MPLRPVSELGLVDITDVPARDGNRTATRRRPAGTRRSPSQPARSDSRDDHQTSTRSDGSERARASRTGKPDAGRRASKNLTRRAPEPASPANSPSGRAAKRLAPSQSRAERTPKLARKAPAPAVDPARKSSRARSNTSASQSEASKRQSARGHTSTPSPRSDQGKRSRITSKPATDTGSGAATRSATARTPKRSNSSTGPPRPATPVRGRTSGGARIKTNPASRETQRSQDPQRVGPTKPLSTAKIGISVLLTASLVTGGLLFARAARQR